MTDNIDTKIETLKDQEIQVSAIFEQVHKFSDLIQQLTTQIITPLTEYSFKIHKSANHQTDVFKELTTVAENSAYDPSTRKTIRQATNIQEFLSTITLPQSCQELLNTTSPTQEQLQTATQDLQDYLSQHNLNFKTITQVLDTIITQQAVIVGDIKSILNFQAKGS